MDVAADLEFIALAPAGFENALAGELRSLGCRRVRPLHGNVSFFGALRDGYRACLWSRLASRVLLVLERVDARDADDLYESCRVLPWEDHIGTQATIAVDARGSSEGVGDRRFAALRVKDAVCDRLRELTGSRPFVDTDAPDVRIVLTLRSSRATVALDLSGSLLDRGWRAPARARAYAGRSSFVREDMAALLLELAGWTGACKRTDRARLVDPLGSSCALVVEAACIAADRAPGLTRRAWGFTGWLGHDASAWDELVREAQERFERSSLAGVRVTVAMADPAARAELADMLDRAGVAPLVDVQACGAGALALGDAPIPDAFVVCAVPDDGVGAGRADLMVRLSSVGALVRGGALAEASIGCLAATGAFADALGLAPDLTLAVKNGSADARIEVFPSAAQAARRNLASSDGHGAEALEGVSAIAADPLAPHLTELTLPNAQTVGVLVPTSDQFAARLARVARQRAKWARREGVTCYRVYDADLPDYAVSVDLYEGCASSPGRWLVMSEYAAPRDVDPDLARRRLTDALAIAPRILDVDPDDVFLKVRRRAKGGSQYAEHLDDRRCALVEEGGLTFEVNFSDYLDTGLFLDHRDVRAMLREMAPRARFLNLFAYTGTASCYAADGDAYTTTTVDLSRTYLEWAQRNMEQNGFVGESHEYVQADVMRWIAEQRRTANRWNLIFVDPPTFSNSSRMRNKGFDVQRDHAELLIGASRLLIRGGTIVFSCNLRGFEPDEEKLARAGVVIRDITERTVPADFARNARVHHCYIVYRD